MVAEILNKWEESIESLTIIPGSGGVYDIWKDEELVYSKTKEGRFPFSDDEVVRLLE